MYFFLNIDFKTIVVVEKDVAHRSSKTGHDECVEDPTKLEQRKGEVPTRIHRKTMWHILPKSEPLLHYPVKKPRAFDMCIGCRNPNSRTCYIYYELLGWTKS